MCPGLSAHPFAHWCKLIQNFKTGREFSHISLDVNVKGHLCVAPREMKSALRLGLVLLLWNDPLIERKGCSEPIQLTLRLLCLFSFIMMNSQKYFFTRKGPAIQRTQHTCSVFCNIKCAWEKCGHCGV